MRTPTCNLIKTMIALAAFGMTAAQAAGPSSVSDAASAAQHAAIQLPPPRADGKTSVESALAARRSVRSFSTSPVSLQELSQLLWATQGITDAHGLRAAPSAGALYPLEVSVIAGLVEGLPAGIYRYQPAGHRLLPVAPGDQRGALAEAAWGQAALKQAPLVIAVAAEYRKTTLKYGERGVRYVHLEAGHAAQNFCLQATALGLGSVVIGAFSDQKVAAILQSNAQQPLYLIPAGRK